MALEQMDAGNLTREIVAPLLATDDTELLAAIIEILGRHPDWAGDLANRFGEWLAAEHPSDQQVATIRGAAAALVAQPKVIQFIAGSLAEERTPKATRLALLETLAGAEFEPPKTWDAIFEQNLRSADDDVARQTIATLASIAPGRCGAALESVGLDAARPADARIAAAACGLESRWQVAAGRV